MDKKNKIALVIKTDGLEYDDRVRKEILSIQKLYPSISFKIFAMLPENREMDGITSYGIPYKTVYIPARDKYSSAQKTMLKAYQFYKAIKRELKEFDAIWAANVDTSFVPLLMPHERILWDLHELPEIYLKNPITRIMLICIFNRCRVVVHANPQRMQYLNSIGVINDISKHFSLRNYPNFEEVNAGFDEMFKVFVEWKGNRKCVYLQGLNMPRRAPLESISAVMDMPELCAVVVGGFDNKIKKCLEELYGNDLQKRVLFVGKIPQLKIPQFVGQCFMSLIFYKNVNKNNYFCEANRFYQSVIMGLPVVVGNNPSMKDLVDEYGLGVSINDDGCSINAIKDGMLQVIKEYDTYYKNIIENRNKLLWDNQETRIIEIVEKLFAD